MTPSKIFTLVFALLLSITLLMELAPRFQPVTENLAPAFFDQQGQPEAAWSGWNPALMTSTADGLVLSATSNRQSNLSLDLNRSILGGATWILIEVDRAYDHIKKGPLYFQRARLVTGFCREDGKPYWVWPHEVMSGEGTLREKSLVKGMLIPYWNTKVIVSIQNLGTGGTLTVRHLRVYGAQEYLGFRILRGFCLMAWVGGFLACLILLKPWRWPQGWLIMGLCGLILTGTCMPGEVFQITGNTLNALLQKVQQPDGSVVLPLPDPLVSSNTQGSTHAYAAVSMAKKGGHYLFFSVLGFLACVSLRSSTRRNALVLALLGCALFAWSSEVGQYFSLLRKATVFDWSIDMSGVFTGLLASKLIRRFSW